MPESPALWELTGFMERLDTWSAEQSGGDQVLRRSVVRWIPSRAETPYAGVRRAEGFPNLWYAAIPGTVRGDRVVVCSYFVYEAEHRVACSSIATLSTPI